jgi:hypothetical protein
MRVTCLPPHPNPRTITRNPNVPSDSMRFIENPFREMVVLYKNKIN